MKAILQRVLSASVTVDQQLVSSIGKGVLVFAAVAPGDTEREADLLASKVIKMKLWDDEDGARVPIPVSSRTGQRQFSNSTVLQWKQSVQDINGEVLCVSQFTLLASIKGSKPDFHGAMAGDQAKELYDYFVSKIQEGYEQGKVKNGVFQAMMKVGLINDGPVTLEISASRKP
ncbi:MAG: D-tyrosyl-tRNA(Tyr) deacylase [Geoglossum simile]|nr:MAG: D-tyrosyl-tRNA(Tyr) deacylase [Geoglossum simile]